MYSLFQCMLPQIMCSCCGTLHFLELFTYLYTSISVPTKRTLIVLQHLTTVIQCGTNNRFGMPMCLNNQVFYQHNPKNKSMVNWLGLDSRSRIPTISCNVASMHCTLKSGTTSGHCFFRLQGNPRHIPFTPIVFSLKLYPPNSSRIYYTGWPTFLFPFLSNYPEHWNSLL